MLFHISAGLKLAVSSMKSPIQIESFKHNFQHLNKRVGISKWLTGGHAKLISYFLIFTSATEGEGRFVFTSFCLYTRYLKELWRDPDKILWTGSVCDKDELIRFW